VFEKEQIDFQMTIIEDMLDLCEANDVSWALWTYKDAATMGIIYPREDTPWRQLTDEIKLVWNQHKEQEKGEALVDYMAETYFKPISLEQRYPLQFRMRTIMQAICVEQNLKPFLQKRSWEEIYELPKSFHWDQCEHWSELADLIVKYTRA
jgi:endoglucanase